MFPSSAEYARHYLGRVAMLTMGAVAALAMAAAVEVPSVRAVDTAFPRLAGDLSGRPDGASRPVPVIEGRLADALDSVADGRSVVWREPETGATYRVDTVASFTAGEKSCRSFTLRRTAEGSLSESYRTACQDADGAWTLTTTARFRALPCRPSDSPPAGAGEPSCPSP